jgi:hypothetical protein
MIALLEVGRLGKWLQRFVMQAMWKDIYGTRVRNQAIISSSKSFAFQTGLKPSRRKNIGDKATIYKSSS